MSKKKKSTTLSLTEDVIGFLNRQDNKSEVPNLLLEQLSDQQTDLDYIQSILNNIDYKTIIIEGIESLKEKATRQRNLQTFADSYSLGGSPIVLESPDNVINPVKQVKEFFLNERPANWTEVKEKFPEFDINDDFFRGNSPRYQQGHYIRSFLHSVGVISELGSSFIYSS